MYNKQTGYNVMWRIWGSINDSTYPQILSRYLYVYLLFILYKYVICSIILNFIDSV